MLSQLVEIIQSNENKTEAAIKWNFLINVHTDCYHSAYTMIQSIISHNHERRLAEVRFPLKQLLNIKNVSPSSVSILSIFGISNTGKSNTASSLMYPYPWFKHAVHCHMHAVTSLIPLLESCKLPCYYSLGVRRGVPLSCYGYPGVKVYIQKQTELFIGRGTMHFCHRGSAPCLF